MINKDTGFEINIRLGSLSWQDQSFVKLLYLSNRFDEFETSLKKLINKSYPQVDLNFAFLAYITIEKMFLFRDNIKNRKDKSVGIYDLKWDTCDAEYLLRINEGDIFT